MKFTAETLTAAMNTRVFDATEEQLVESLALLDILVTKYKKIDGWCEFKVQLGETICQVECKKDYPIYMKGIKPKTIEYLWGGQFNVHSVAFLLRQVFKQGNFSVRFRLSGAKNGEYTANEREDLVLLANKIAILNGDKEEE